MTLNPTKTVLHPLARGVDHLGWFHKTTHVRLRNRVKQALWQFINSGHATECDVKSRLGYLKHGDTRRLKEAIMSSPLPRAQTFPDLCQLRDCALPSLFGALFDGRWIGRVFHDFDMIDGDLRQKP
jgi:hypothetical protein